MTGMNRRSVLKTGLAAGVGLGIGGLARPALAQQVQLSFAVWASDAEAAAYRAAIGRFEAANPGIKVELEVMPYNQFYQQVDTRLAGRQGFDLFRITYQHVGRYAMNGAAIDLSDYIDAGHGEAFTPAIWQAVTYDDVPHALPHHTDTFALIYNADALDKAGIAVPGSMEAAWTWAQLLDNARTLKAAGAGNYPFAMAWQNGSVHRWLPFLYQHGGRLLNDDLTAAAIANAAGVETVAFNQSWFTEGLVPPSTSVKSSEKTQNLFANGIIPMLMNGNWQMPFIEAQAKFNWSVTYMPRDVAMADDLGGTAVAVSRDCDEPEAAAAFAAFLTDEANMRDFVVEAQFLPVRTSLVESGVDYKLRPAEMKVFVEQTTVIPPHMVQTVVMPTWGKFVPRLADELELAFTSGQSAEDTVAAIEGHVENLLIVS